MMSNCGSSRLIPWRTFPLDEEGLDEEEEEKKGALHSHPFALCFAWGVSTFYITRNLVSSRRTPRRTSPPEQGWHEEEEEGTRHDLLSECRYALNDEKQGRLTTYPAENIPAGAAGGVGEEEEEK